MMTSGGSIHDHAGGRPIQPDRGDHRGGTPVTVRGERKQPGAVTGSAPQAGHIRLGTRLINENKSRGVKFRQITHPLLAPHSDVLTLLLAGMQRFFYSGMRVDPAPAAPP